MIQTKRQPPTVRVDGDAIRQIRESKALTQLYVAEVVGVSVDTVSRWENNRTQAVRRDNAEALAQALEVNLEEVLQAAPEPAAETAPEQAPTQPLPRRRVTAAAVAVAILILSALAYWRYTATAPLVVAADRRLPAYAPPGTEIPVVVAVRVVSGEGRRVILREFLPADWELVGAVAPPDQGPTDGGVVKWILPLDQGKARLTYVVRTPTDGEEGSNFRFKGEVVTSGRNGKPIEVKGAGRIDLEYIHWADEDADFEIGDAEVLDALERLEGARGLGLNPTDLRDLWGAEEYAWDSTRKNFRPVDR